MNIETRKKYLNYFIATTPIGQRPMRINNTQIKKLRYTILGYDFLWSDVERHGGDKYSHPILLRNNTSEHNFTHCKSNFWSIILELAINHGVMKIKGIS